MEALRAIFDEMGFDLEQVRVPQAAAIYALAKIYTTVARDLGAVYKRFGLTATSFNLLVLVHHGKDRANLTQQAISQRLVVTESDITKVIDRLERQHLVRRVPGRDRRSKLLQISPKGVQRLEAVWPHHRTAMERLARAIEPGDVRVLAQILGRLRRLRDGA
jgi:MarR family 2-MHQ and catechol resistance regulon transcriptional repressor